MTTPIPTNPMPEDRERRLFAQALSHPPGAAREAWLAEACGGDEALERRVRALLRAHDEASGFLPDLAPTLVSPASEQPGESIGPYKLLQRIGEGGFGTVWMAEQTQPVTRRVALKIVKLGMDTREVIARFEAERQALAMMDHPHIAKVLDAGATDRGRPFFVMELVKGIPVTQFCDENHLDTRQRLALFADVCSAINHAHQKGVIHRDIKPSNVLVTLHGDKAVVKVIDFGIAKATQGKLTDKTLFTRFEQFIGTPVYMSPEQAALSGLDIDTRSDIYALGVLLYELLTGAPPFDAKSLASAGYEEMRRIIREVEPPKPSARLSTLAGDQRATLARARHVQPDRLSRLVEPDLDWIVMKAIDKDRTRRYETANGLALDIQRFLADEPVSATPPSAGYRFRKFARRHKAVLRAVGTLLLVLVVATAFSTRQAILATRARESEREEKRKAQDKEREAREVLQFFEDNVLAAARPEGQDGGLGINATIKQAIEAAEPKIGDSFKDRPLVEASIRRAIGKTWNLLDKPGEAVRQLERTLEVRTRAYGPEHPETLDTIIGLAGAYERVGRFKDCLALSEKACAIARRTLGAAHPKTLEVTAYYSVYLGQAGRVNQALAQNEALVGLCREHLSPQDPLRLKAEEELARSWLDRGWPQRAVVRLEELLAVRQSLNGPKHPLTIALMDTLAGGYEVMGQEEKGIHVQKKVVELSREVLGAQHSSTLSATVGLAVLIGNSGNHEEEVLRLLEEAKATAMSRREPTGPPLPALLDTLGVTLTKLGQADQALSAFEQAYRVSREAYGPEDSSTLRRMWLFAGSLNDAGRLDEANALTVEGVALCRKVVGRGDPVIIDVMLGYAEAMEDLAKPADALALRKEAFELARAELGPEHAQTLEATEKLAWSLLDEGKADEALGLQKEAVRLRTATNGPDHPKTVLASTRLGALLIHAHHLEEARGLLDEALVTARRLTAVRSATVLDVQRLLSTAFAALGDRDKALELRRKNWEEAPRIYGWTDVRTGDDANRLSDLLAQVGKSEEAIRVCQTAVEEIRNRLGPAHRQTLRAMEALVTVLWSAERFPEVLELRRAMLPGYRRAYGAQSDRAYAAAANLSISLGKAGQLQEAIPLCEGAVAGLRAKANARPSTLGAALVTLAELYEKDGRRDQALPLRQEALALVRGARTPGWNGVLGSLLALGNTLTQQGRRTEAVDLVRESLTISRTLLGPEHPDTLRATNQLLCTLDDSVETAEAAREAEAALPLFKRVLGPQHIDTLCAMNNLAWFRLKLGRNEGALSLFKEAWAALETMDLPASHPLPLLVRRNLVEAYEAVGQRENAAALLKEPPPESPDTAPPSPPKDFKALQESLEALKRDKGEESPEAIEGMIALAAAHAAEANGSQGIKLAEFAYRLAKRVLGQGDPRTIEARITLARLYRLVDMTEEARRLEAKGGGEPPATR